MKTLDRMAPERLEELVAAFPRLRIAVVGDFFLDKYLDVDPARAEVSVETGKTAHQVVGIRHSPGAAGTVMCNLAALKAETARARTGSERSEASVPVLAGERSEAPVPVRPATLHAVGFTGNDGDGYELRRDLAALGCDTEHLHQDRDRRTPTYLKPRDCGDPSLAGEHNRYDTKNRTPTPAATQERIIRSLDALLPHVDALIAMDQIEEPECGVVTAAVRDFLAQAALRYPRVVFWADSRRRIRWFRGVIIKPNQFEAAGREDPRPGDEVDLAELEAVMPRLWAETGAPVCVTRGAAGMAVYDGELTIVPGVRVTGPIDPTGAGDSATAGAVLALAAGASLPEAAVVGNLVASITVQQLATTGTARPEELPPRLAIWQASVATFTSPGAQQPADTMPSSEA